MSERPQKVTLMERQRAVWHDNHIGIILTVMAVILLVGAAVLAYRQSRFQPPRFPDASTFQTSSRQPMVDSVAGKIPASEALTINVIGAGTETGRMCLAIYADKANFNEPEKAIARDYRPIVEGMSTFTYRKEDLPEQFALAAYHDENVDGLLNRNAIGVPLERYGFSNDARSSIGPPSFDESLIERPESGSIQLFIR